MQRSRPYLQLSVLVFLGLLLFVSSCRKKGDNEKLTGENTSANTIMPTDSGSWWLMKDNSNNISITTATGRDTFIANNVYDYFEMKDTNTHDITPYFYAKHDPYYLSLVDITSNGDYVPMIISTVNPQPGDTWTNTAQMTYMSIPIDIKMEGSVTTTTGSLTINGHTYENVIETLNTLKAKPSVSPAWINAGTLHMYFVKGIGIIENDLNVNVAGFFQTQISQQLLDYHIQ